MRALAQDLRYAVRNLLRNPAFTAIAVAALAIGIGANTAVFTVVESVLLRPLPYYQPSRLYTVRTMSTKANPFVMGTMSDPGFLACRSASVAFQQLAAYDFWNWNATGVGDPVAVHGRQVTANFFATLGVQPQLGRGFSRTKNRLIAPRFPSWAIASGAAASTRIPARWADPSCSMASRTPWSASCRPASIRLPRSGCRPFSTPPTITSPSAM